MKSSFIRTLLESEDGPTAVEYAVLMALIIVAVISAINAVGGAALALWKVDLNGVTSAS